MARRCKRCGRRLSAYNRVETCASCEASGPSPKRSESSVVVQPLLWASRAGQAALATRDLGTILRAYRRATGLTQARLGQMLILDQSYVSRIETGERPVTDVRILTQIAKTLGIPPHALGLTSDDGGDFKAMVEFASSTLRLAEMARQLGRPMDAVAELWPLVVRLDARLAEGRADRETVVLAARGQLSLGVALGHVLPEERLDVAASWTGRALSLIVRLEDRALHAHALRLHGNELRKCGQHAGAIGHLNHAVGLVDDIAARGAGLGLLARATAEIGDAAAFDSSVAQLRRLLEQDYRRSVLFNPFVLNEIRIRGLLATGRPKAAGRLVESEERSAGRPDATPQWRVLDAVTCGQAMLACGDADGAIESLRPALSDAERYRMPHQIQRALRVLHSIPGDSGAKLVETGTAKLRRLQDQLGTSESKLRSSPPPV